jgi:[ribosomal protein S5]-alanine N-acetyltransferase
VSPPPALRTTRLVLNGFAQSDAPELQRLAGAREIAATTLAIPHPYLLEHAQSWIDKQNSGTHDSSVNFAIRLATTNTLIGSVGLKEIGRTPGEAELGFWIGVPWWGQGYAREAARGIIQYGFDTLKLNRIYAHHMTRNPASGRALSAAGMRREGLLPKGVLKWGVEEDVVLYAVMRDDWS